jgi:hypothetical protein
MMVDSNSLDEPLSMFNDPSSTDEAMSREVAFATIPTYASCAAAEIDAPAVLSRSVSCSSSDHKSFFDTIDEPQTDSPGEIDDPRAAQGTGAYAKSKPRSRAVFVDRSILDSMTHLPRDKVAQTLGVCSTTFKKVCRRAGLKGWPYRRPLLGTTMEGCAAVPFSQGSSTPSDSQETLHRAYSSPVRFLSTFAVSHVAAQRTAPLPVDMMPMRYTNLLNPSFSSSSSSGAASDGAFGYLAPPPAQRSCPSDQSTHVVDAVMDYLDTLSSGCAAAHDTAAVHRCELEAVVDASTSRAES